MNKILAVGNLAKLNFNDEGKVAVCKFTLALEKDYKKVEPGEKPGADFVGFVAFGSLAEFLNRNQAKISALSVEAHFQTGSYQGKDGNTVYTEDKVAEKVKVVAWKNAQPAQDNPQAQQSGQPQGYSQAPRPQQYQAPAQQSLEGYFNPPDYMPGDEGLPFR